MDASPPCSTRNMALTTTKSVGRYAPYDNSTILQILQTGLVLSFCGASALLSPLIGSLADRYGAIQVARRGMFVGAVAFLLLYFSQLISHTAIRLVYVCTCQFINCAFFRSLFPVVDAYTIQWLAVNSAPQDTSSADSVDRYGRHRLCGAVSWGLVSLLIGVAMDISGTAQVMFVSMVVSAAGFALLLRGEGELQVDLDRGAFSAGNVVSDLRKLFESFTGSKVVLGTFFLLMFVLAAGMAIVENLLFLYFKEDLNSSYTLMGLSVVITVAAEIPLFAASGYLLKVAGEEALILIGVASFSLRAFAYTLISEENQWMVLLCEPFHGGTIALTYTARVIYVSKSLATEDSQALAQTTISAVQALGMMLGTLSGGFIQEHLGSTFLYRFHGTVVTVAALLYAVAAFTKKSRTGSLRYLKVKDSGREESETETSTDNAEETELTPAIRSQDKGTLSDG